MTVLLVAFAPPPAAHWVPRLQAGGVDVEVIPSPIVGDDNSVSGLPAQQDGVVILVNARVAAALKGQRTDLVALPQGAPQINDKDDPAYTVNMDYLLPV